MRAWRPALLTWTLLAALGLTPSTGRADEIELTGGQSLLGVIEEENSQEIVIVVAGLSRMSVPRERIVSVSRTGPAENALLMGELHLDQGMPWLAAQNFSEALERGLAPERIAPALLSRPTALVMWLQQMPDEQAASFRTLCLNILSALERDGAVLHLAGRLCQVTGEPGRAWDAFTQIDPEWWFDHPAESRSAADFFRAEAWRALDENDFDRVGAALEQMTVVDLSLATQLRPIFLIRQANMLIDQGEWGAAITLVGDTVMAETPQIATLWLESVFLELEHRPLTAQEISQIIPVFARHCPRYFPENADERLAGLYGRLGEAHLAQGNYDHARYAFNRQSEIIDPTAVSRPMVVAVNLLEEADQMAPDDWEGRIRLTVQMVDNELWDEALEQLAILAESPDSEIRVYATQQRRAIEGQLAQESYLHAFDLYDSADFAGALDVLERDANLFHSARLGTEVDELLRLCRIQMREESNRRIFAALARQQQAERHFMSGQFSEAIELYQVVIRDYPETAAAEDAAARLPRARAFMALRQGSPGGFDLTTGGAASGEVDPIEARREEFESLLNATEGAATERDQPALL